MFSLHIFVEIAVSPEDTNKAIILSLKPTARGMVRESPPKASIVTAIDC